MFSLYIICIYIQIKEDHFLTKSWGVTWNQRLMFDPFPPLYMHNIYIHTHTTHLCCICSALHTIIIFFIYRGWGFLAGLGSFCSFVTSFRACLYGNAPGRFIFPFLLGNLISILATNLLLDPLSQLNNIVDKDRWQSVLVCIIFLPATAISAFTFQSLFFTLIFFTLQECAYGWYCISFIPYSQELVLTVITSGLQGVRKLVTKHCGGASGSNGGEGDEDYIDDFELGLGGERGGGYDRASVFDEDEEDMIL